MPRLIPGRYPEERNWEKWVTFIEGAHPWLALVQLWRMAAFARDVLKRPWVFVAGFRTYAEQKALYDAWVNYQNHPGTAPKATPATAPGFSLHEFHVAGDTKRFTTVEKDWPELWADYHRAPDKQVLATYGLGISNWIGSDTGVHEWWHIVPSEAIKYTGPRPDFLMWDDLINGEGIMLKLNDGPNDPNVLSWQNGLVAVESWPMLNGVPDPEPNGNYGPTTATWTAKFQQANGLTVNGNLVAEPDMLAMIRSVGKRCLQAQEDAALHEAAQALAETARKAAEATVASQAAQVTASAKTAQDALAAAKVAKDAQTKAEAANANLVAQAAATKTHVKALVDLAK